MTTCQLNIPEIYLLRNNWEIFKNSVAWWLYRILDDLFLGKSHGHGRGLVHPIGSLDDLHSGLVKHGEIMGNPVLHPPTAPGWKLPLRPWGAEKKRGWLIQKGGHFTIKHHQKPWDFIKNHPLGISPSADWGFKLWFKLWRIEHDQFVTNS